MKAVRIELTEANQLVSSLHRHHKPVVGHRFSIGAKKYHSDSKNLKPLLLAIPRREHAVIGGSMGD